ncbi:hypothetical protein B0H12DRAFT_1279377 [Mycena haematopus]|nr:hypothetical protein B0H12DRAFT_1279377 [Mycena haematopus]
MYDIGFTERFMTKVSGAQAQYVMWLAGASEVSEYSKGEKFLQKDGPQGGQRKFFTADSVSEAEILVLLGFIPGKDADQDRTLFPTPAMCEEYSNHFRGMIGAGALQIVLGLVHKAGNNPKWMTKAQWKSYLCPNNFGTRAASYIPNDIDFKEMAEKFAKSFPISWQHIRVSEIRIPEAFDDRAHQK